ncbi:glyoxalase superfamily protein [Pedobacter lusitanus]
MEKDYKFNKPGLDIQPWNDKVNTMEIIDPFGNRLTFNG